MQDKFEFNELPTDLQIKIARHLDAPDLLSLTFTSTKSWGLFKPMFDVRKLLQQVILCNHDAVALMLKNNINLIFHRGRITDCSGRTFSNISAFEYGLWALDKHMWTMMFDCIPKNEEGKKVLKILLAQLNNLEKSGIIYELQGKTITESHYDFAIINKLQTQVNLADGWGKDWDSIDKQWQKEVGGAQKNLPVHVVDEYCSHKPFYLKPDFISRPTTSRQFYNCETSNWENWFDLGSKLGVDFAIYKSLAGSAQMAHGASFVERHGYGYGMRRLSYDLVAMTALCEVRTKDVANLKSQLEKELAVDNEPIVFQI